MSGTHAPAPGLASVLIPELHGGDVVHIADHEVFRHTEWAHQVTCGEADVLVDCLILVGRVIVICWRACPGGCTSRCGAVVYDADDHIGRVQVAA